MLLVSTSVLETAVVFSMMLLVKCADAAYAFIVSPIAKKKSGSGDSFSRICHRLNMGVCLPALVALPSSTRIICTYHKALSSTTSVRCASGAEPSNGKGFSAKTGMRLKDCMPKVQCIWIRLGACQSYKLVGILITEYFFYWFPLHAYLKYARSSLFGFP